MVKKKKQRRTKETGGEGRELRQKSGASCSDGATLLVLVAGGPSYNAVYSLLRAKYRVARGRLEKV